MLKYRVLSALILIPLVVGVVFFFPIQWFVCVIGLLCALAAWEWGALVGIKNQGLRILLALLIGVLLTSSFYLTRNSLFLYNEISRFFIFQSLGWWLIASCLVITYPRSANFWNSYYFAKLIFGLFIIFPFFFSLIALKQLNIMENGGTHLAGHWLVMYIILLVWITDTFAYFCGKAWGKHKMIPSVSPGKTWEGLLGGLLGAGIFIVLTNYTQVLSVSGGWFMISSAIAVIASIFGDLTESMFKREASVKDSSNLIPGHGGILDRLDSLTAAIPIFTSLFFLAYR